MKILVTYASLTGNTQKLAEGIFEALSQKEKEIRPMMEVDNTDEYDVVLAGYWVDKGGPNQEASEFLGKLENKTIGLFATLGYWPDSEHAYGSLKKGEALVEEKNKVFCRYICQGKLSDKIIDMFKQLPEGNPHAITEEKLFRYKIAENHPSEADIALAGELFEERLQSICLKQE